MSIDLVIVLVFITYSIATGLWMRQRASRNLEEYFLAGRKLKGWQAGVSMAATQYAADTPLLVTGLIATAGLFSLWRLWIYALAFLLMGFVLGKCWRRSGVLTDAELTEIRYSGQGASWLRALKAVHMGTLFNCTVLAMVLLAATRIAEPFLTWHLWLPSDFMQSLAQFMQSINFKMTTLPDNSPFIWQQSANNLLSILCIVSFTLLYSTTGGLRSVVATDILQFFIAMLATGIYAWVVLKNVGGFTALGEKLKTLYGTEAHLSLTSFFPQHLDEITLVFFGVLAIQWFAQANADGTGYLAQRTMACQTDQDAKQAAVIFSFLQIVLRSLLWLPIILGLLVLYPAAQLSLDGSASESFRLAREATFATGIKDYLPMGARGLMLTGLLAALASTIDTHLNWGASYWTNDLYKGLLMKKGMKREPDNRELVWVARFSNVLILVLALIIMKYVTSIQTAWHISLLFGSGLGVVLILRWIWYRVNQWSEITAVAISLILSPILIISFPDWSEGFRLLVMVFVSTTGVMAVTLFTPPESDRTLRNFCERVDPPGFWPFSVSKAPISRFFRALLAMFLCALSIFLLLIGLGQLILGSNPWNLTTLFAIFGLGLTPLWLKLGFKD